VVGPTGAGKSVLLALMALQFRPIQTPRSSPLIGCSVRAATIAMGGDWHDIGGVLSGESMESLNFSRLRQLTTV